MPGKSEGASQAQNRERMFNGGAYLSHHAHVKVGVRKDKGCGFCERGLDAVVTSYEAPVRENSMDEDTGDDEERSASHPFSDGDQSKQDFELRW